MANLITDPGFELDAPQWTFGGLGVRSTTQAHTGSWSAKLKARQGFSPGVSSVQQNLTGLVPGSPYLFEYWRWAHYATQFTTLHARIDWGAGFQEYQYLPFGAASLWQPASVFFVPDGTTATASFNVTHDGEPADVFSEDWYVDSTVLDVKGGGVLTDTLKNALLADLATIRVENGYATDVATVSTKPNVGSKLPKPAITVQLAGGEAANAELSQRQGDAVQLFELRLMLAATADPETNMANFLDDVRNVVENKGTLRALTKVLDATVVDWEPVEGSDDEENLAADLDAVVAVSYAYGRGLL